MEHIKGVIFDIDGVLESYGRPCPGAVETVNTLTDNGIILRFLTNSTLKSRVSCAAKLAQAGFRIVPEQVITASYATATYLRELRPRSCWIMLEREGLDEFADLEQDTEDPEYVVVGDNRSRFDFEYLSKALRLLLRGARLIGMMSELVDTSMGQIELNVGSWVEMLARASGVSAIYVGKPAPYAFELALSTMGLEKDEVVMVGDQVATDVVGAKGVGIRAILLRTDAPQEKEPDLGVEPDLVVHSVGEILGLFGLGTGHRLTKGVSANE